MDVHETVSRRTLLKGVGLAVLGAGAVACTSRSEPEPDAAAAVVRPLPIPPVLAPRKVGKTKVFSLEARTGTSEIVPGTRTGTWGYNGANLGPTIRVTRGDNVRINVRNALPDTTTVHWHGLHVPPDMDGGPHQPIEAGRAFAARFRVRQQAATLWYHPDLHGSTSLQTSRGLAGMMIVDDAATSRHDLPRRYGMDDIPLILQDKRFTATGALDETDRADVGLLGDTPTVNGITQPTFTATTRRVRFRIVDASTARLYNLAFSDNRRFTVIGTDGGLLDKPMTATSIGISPGERTEIVVDLTPGETIQLRAVAFPGNLGVDDAAPDFGLQDEFDLMTVIGPAPTAPKPRALPTGLNPTLRDSPNTGIAHKRYFDLQWFQINGQLFDPTRVDAVVPVGRTEIWTVRNTDTWIHNFHIHGTQFRVLSLDKAHPKPPTAGWKDTVLLPPGAVARLAVRFTDYTSTRWPYQFGCHLMFHQDKGMEGQLVVVRPGQKPSAVLGRPPRRRKR
ncbi:multicopper oxidase domain-containing protein [Gordonia malaquae]|uniref:multicopper oxidase family protein n=1 Tax=Gordonia malaquae TaxID=410332 RepID=UPI0030C79ACE